VRIKTDENIGKRAVDLLRTAGHNVTTVREQGLAGQTDQTVFRVCCTERRTLVTLDREFGEPLRFPSDQSAGIVVLEPGAPASINLLLDRLRDFLALASTRAVEGELWIVEPGRVRVRSRNDR
jgi:hypothetical protein